MWHIIKGAVRCSVCHEKGHNKLSKHCRGFPIEVNDREDGFFELTTNIGWGFFSTDNDDDDVDDNIANSN